MSGIGLFLAALRGRLASDSRSVPQTAPVSADELSTAERADVGVARGVQVGTAAGVEPVLRPLELPDSSRGLDRPSASSLAEQCASATLVGSLVDYESDASSTSCPIVSLEGANPTANMESVVEIPPEVDSPSIQPATVISTQSNEDIIKDVLLGVVAQIVNDPPRDSVSIMDRSLDINVPSLTGDTLIPDAPRTPPSLSAPIIGDQADSESIAALSTNVSLSLSPSGTQCCVVINSPSGCTGMGTASGDNSLESFADIALGLNESSPIRSLRGESNDFSGADSTCSETLADCTTTEERVAAAGEIRDCYFVLDRLPEDKSRHSAERSQNHAESGSAQPSLNKPLTASDAAAAAASTTDPQTIRAQKALRLKAILRGIRLPPPSAPARRHKESGKVSVAQSLMGTAASDPPYQSDRGRGAPASASGPTVIDHEKSDRSLGAPTSAFKRTATGRGKTVLPVAGKLSDRAPSAFSHESPTATVPPGGVDSALKHGEALPKRSQSGAPRIAAPKASAKTVPMDDPCETLSKGSQSSAPQTAGPKVLAKTVPMDEPNKSRTQASKRRPSTVAAQSVGEEESADSSASSCEPPAKRPKGDRETQLRAEWMAHPERIFGFYSLATLEKSTDALASADGALRKRSGHPKAGPTAVVPPATVAVRTRPQLTPATLRKLIKDFIKTPGAVLDFKELQHLERLAIVRALIPRAYARQHDVEPLLHLLAQNGRDESDPLSAIAAGLQAKLIDTRFLTQTSSAHLLLFNYLVALFMQRWAIMAPATTAIEQWRSIAQGYTNWNGHGRWVECFLIAPSESVELARRVLKDGLCALSSDFQQQFGAAFVTQRRLLEKWVLARRCSVAVADDQTGHSLYMDLIVSPNALWLVSSDAERRKVDRAYKKVNATALPADPSARITYPAAAVYQATIRQLTDLLASATTGGTHIRHVDRILQEDSQQLQPTGWITYSGNVEAISTAVAQLQPVAPTRVSTNFDTETATMTVTCDWLSSETAVDSTLAFTVPANPIPDQNVAPASQSTLAPTVSSLLVISEAHGTFERVRLLNTFLAFGSLVTLVVDPITASIYVQYATVGSAQKALVCLYAPQPREVDVHYALLPLDIMQSATTTSLLINASASTENTLCVLGDTERAIDFNLAVYQAAALVEALEIEQPTTDLLTQLRVFLHASAAVATARRLPVVPLTQLLSRLLVCRNAPVDIAAVRLKSGRLLDRSGTDYEEAFACCLRLLILYHLQQHAHDEVLVVPPGWLDPGAGLAVAASYPALYAHDDCVTDPTDCRILFIPILASNLLVIVASPQSLQSLGTRPTAPLIIIFGVDLSVEVVRTLLVALFVRLEAVMCEGCPLTRPKVIVFDYARQSSVGGAPVTNAHSAANLPVLLAHAARIWLRLLTAPNDPTVYAELFTDISLIQGTRDILWRYSDGQELAVGDTSNEQLRQISDWWERHAEAPPHSLPTNDLLASEAYTRYLAVSCLRREQSDDWANPSAISAFAVGRSTTGLHVFLNTELGRRGNILERAIHARLQQLHRRGFMAVGCWKQTIELRRGLAENAWLTLPDLSLQSATCTYRNIDELAGGKNCWNTLPVWFVAKKS